MFLSDVSRLSRQSHAKVRVKCCFEACDKCTGIKEMQYRDVMNNIERNDGKYICLFCSRHLKYSGNNNPNCQYEYDRDLLEVIDSREKAYLLGWIASDGNISKDDWSISINIHEKDVRCLEQLRDMVCESLPIKSYRENMVTLLIASKKMCEDACRHLKINRGKKSDVVKFPDLQNEELQWVFLRGYFDGDGSIRDYNNKSTPECNIASDSKEMLASIKQFTNIPCNINYNRIEFYGTNCIDFLGKLYDDSCPLRLQRKYDQHVDWLTWRYYEVGKGNSTILPECYVFKTDANAIFPSKAKPSDVGYDLTIIKEEKKFLNNVTLYDTGIKIRVKHGLYAEIIPRSSLSKSGYMLVNSTGIIDPSYNGNLFVALVKIDPDAPNIVFPFKCCQLIFRHQIHVEMIEVVEPFDETARNEGGFGSSGP